MATISFHLKDPKAPRSTSIFMWFYDGRRIRIYTGEKITPAQWDATEQRAKTRGKNLDPVNEHINTNLVRMRKRILEYAAERRAQGQLPTAEELRQIIEPEEITPKAKPLPDFDAYIERLSLIRQPATIKSIRTTYRHLVAYAGQRQLEYDDLTLSFYEGFTHYLLEVVGLTDNSLSKQISILKQFLADAVNRGHSTNEGYKRWGWSRQDPDIIALTRPELAAIESLDLPLGSHLDNARGLFLLSCYTGLRFSDVAALKPEHDRGDRLRLTTQKTRDTLTIPLHPKARPLLARIWAGSLHPISNQKLNSFLKELGKRAGIDKPTEHNSYRGGRRLTSLAPKHELLSSHTGRRTFVTLSLESGLPWEVIMKATGHKDMKSFRRYIQVTEDRQVSEFGRVWGREQAA